jgi:3-keto-5-aminohexanoate cleavage enzyme
MILVDCCPGCLYPWNRKEAGMSQEEWEGVRWAEMVLRQEKNRTMDKPLIITVCPTGALFSRRHNPHLPYTPEEIARDVVESYREGASMAHIHTRSEGGYPRTSVETLKRIIDLVLDECPDMIIQPSSCESYVPGATDYSYESVKPFVDKLRGKKYMESTIFTPVSYALEEVDGPVDVTMATEKNTQETVKYLQKNGIKPDFMNHNWEGVQNVKEWLVKPGILEKPYLLSMGPGMHNTGETYPDPWGMMYVLGMMKMMPEGSVVSISAGGRNWLALSSGCILTKTIRQRGARTKRGRSRPSPESWAVRSRPPLKPEESWAFMKKAKTNNLNIHIPIKKV